MSKIRVLHPHIANQIAAGEVVERPASVVKELVENAIDAGASSITIEIENGGIDYIRVTDNGTGILAEDCLLAFERHATSKIASQEDLGCIETLGFRGEALASIASVSQVELKTRTSGQEMGMRVRIEGGEKKLAQSVGAAKGTTVEVSNLFYNVPARRKFLKSVRSEAGYIGDYISRMLMVRADISFRYINNQKTVYHSAGDSNLKNAIFCVYGDSVLPHLKPLAFDDGYLKIEGFIGTSEISRPNRAHQSFFLNGRYFHSPAISQALYQAYEQHLMGKRYPFALLLITVSSREVDVNVHPNKLEVRFAQEGRVMNAVMLSARKALGVVAIPDISWPQRNSSSFAHAAYKKNDEATGESEGVGQSNDKKKNAQALPFEELFDMNIKSPTPLKEGAVRVPHFSVTPPAHAVPKKTFEEKEEIFNRLPPLQQAIDEIEADAVGAQGEQTSFDASAIFVVGQVFDTYWIVQQDTYMYIVDQHAAHERRLYERLMAQKEPQATQLLLVPLSIRFNGMEIDVLIENEEILFDLGFRYMVVEEHTLQLHEIPAILTQENAERMLRDALEFIQSKGAASTKELRKEAIVQSACKHAIKAGDQITPLEIEELLQYFSKTGVPLTCPHGRPVMIRLNRRELEKMFKRIV
ncbi:DNA mismatch repair endonuclease MutL [Christensenellaceae bacterium OttesenSCG-928-L17]|nr:DNA mismatch repair endonuclease MutL [Christensenellaceae bacterium OttesenSCG-928-L17]